MPLNQTKPHHIYIYKEDLGLNNLQSLICHKIQPNQIICTFIFTFFVVVSEEIFGHSYSVSQK